MRRALLPIELEGGGEEAPGGAERGGMAAIHKRAAGRGTSLPGSFAKFSGVEPGSEDDDMAGPRSSRQFGGGKGGGGGGKGGGRKGGGKGEGLAGRGGRGGRGGDFGLQAGGGGRGSSRGRGAMGKGGAKGGGGKGGGTGGRRRRGDDSDGGIFDDAEMGWADDGGEGGAGLPYDGLTMRELRVMVAEGQFVFPMKIPKPKGLAKLCAAPRLALPIHLPPFPPSPQHPPPLSHLLTYYDTYLL